MGDRGRRVAAGRAARSARGAARARADCHRSRRVRGAREPRGLGRVSETRATGCLRAALQALALAVCAQAVAGFAGVLYRPVSIAILAASLLALLRGVRRHLATPPGAPWTRLEIGLGAALVALLGERLWAGLHATEFHYDVLSFHLHFPVAWLQAHRIEIVPTPFGDLAPAYGPSNAELLYELVLAPLRSDALARVGQLPFAA